MPNQAHPRLPAHLLPWRTDWSYDASSTIWQTADLRFMVGHAKREGRGASPRETRPTKRYLSVGE